MEKVFIHIGLAKTGSTFLQSWFRSHPQLLYVPNTIAGFRNCRAIIDLAHSSKQETPRYYVTSCVTFAPAWVGSQTYLGLPSNLTFKRDPEESRMRLCNILYELFPAARILIVTRGFKSSLSSAFSEYVKHGGTLGYSAFLNTYKLHLEHWLDLNSVIDLYSTTFGEARVLVIPYELLTEDPRRFLYQIEEYLGLDRHDFKKRRLNPSLSPQELYWYTRISSWVDLFSRILKQRHREKFHRFYVSQLFTKRLRPLVHLLNFFGDPAPQNECPDEYLQFFREKGTVLKKNPLYAPYSAEYLW